VGGAAQVECFAAQFIPGQIAQSVSAHGQTKGLLSQVWVSAEHAQGKSDARRRAWVGEGKLVRSCSAGAAARHCRLHPGTFPVVIRSTLLGFAPLRGQFVADQE
jgi:hypothetical protein